VVDDCLYERAEDRPKVLSKISDHCQQSADLDQHIKRKDLALRDVPFKDKGYQDQVGRRGDREEFSESLDNTQDKGL
jgi:hypothetical protein